MGVIILRIVSAKEQASCPAYRLDAEHWIPIHRTWECKHGSLRTRGAIMKAWIMGKITTNQLKLAMKYT